MKRYWRTCLIAAILLLVLPATALADGKFYPPPETVPPDLPYQRALIAHDGAKELLILQSKFEGEAEEFGWVVPLPAVPELASMDTFNCDSLFGSLDRSTGLVEVDPLLQVLLVLFLVSLVLMLYAGISAIMRHRSAAAVGVIGAILFFTTVFLMCSRFPGCGMEDRAVEVLAEQQVGIYDVKVIKAQDSGELIGWLQEHGYQFDQADRDTFDSYIKRGWCFVTARIDLKKGREEGFSSSEGLVNPLVMLFESKELVYPLALTGTIGSETVVLLYVFDSHKVTDGSGRFTLRYAGPDEIRHFESHLTFEPENFRENWSFTQSYLTKLKATLTPEQMKEDLILQHAPDDTPYRERIYRW